MRTLKTLIFLVTLLFTLNSFASQHLPKTAPYPGGIAVLTLKTQTNRTPEVFYKERRTMVLRNHDDELITIVGIPLAEENNEQTIYIKTFLGETVQTFPLLNKDYQSAHITIKDKSKVTPDPELKKRIDHEEKEFHHLLATFHDKQKVFFDFALPVKGPFSSPFGLRRVYNNVLHARHTGLDIAAVQGTPIHAPASGKVLAVRDYVLTGNTVMLDHGQGLISFYGHMETVKVKAGQVIHQGDVLGTVGKTGRVTGAHLHWGTSLNGALVNPLLFVIKEPVQAIKKS